MSCLWRTSIAPGANVALSRAQNAFMEVDVALQQTEHFWTTWLARNKYQGPYRAAVERSLITLKAMTYRPSGGIVAAPTTSLPERIGGPLNWDYRYCWIRDATLTLSALIECGFTEEV